MSRIKKGFKLGNNTHRLLENDPYHKKEIDFVVLMNREINYRGNHGFIKNIVNPLGHTISEIEEKAAMSVIQWLGTHVGQEFIKEANKM